MPDGPAGIPDNPPVASSSEGKKIYMNPGAKPQEKWEQNWNQAFSGETKQAAKEQSREESAENKTESISSDDAVSEVLGKMREEINKTAEENLSTESSYKGNDMVGNALNAKDNQAKAAKEAYEKHMDEGKGRVEEAVQKKMQELNNVPPKGDLIKEYFGRDDKLKQVQKEAADAEEKRHEEAKKARKETWGSAASAQKQTSQTMTPEEAADILGKIKPKSEAGTSAQEKAKIDFVDQFGQPMVFPKTEGEMPTTPPAEAQKQDGQIEATTPKAQATEPASTKTAEGAITGAQDESEAKSATSATTSEQEKPEINTAFEDAEKELAEILRNVPIEDQAAYARQFYANKLGWKVETGRGILASTNIVKDENGKVIKKINPFHVYRTDSDTADFLREKLKEKYNKSQAGESKVTPDAPAQKFEETIPGPDDQHKDEETPASDPTAEEAIQGAQDQREGVTEAAPAPVTPAPAAKEAVPGSVEDLRQKYNDYLTALKYVDEKGETDFDFHKLRNEKGEYVVDPKTGKPFEFKFYADANEFLKSSLEQKTEPKAGGEAGPKPPETRTGPATWRTKDGDQPIVITGYAGKGPDGKDYYNIEGSLTGVPVDEIVEAPGDASKAPETETPNAQIKGPEITPNETADILGKIDQQNKAKENVLAANGGLVDQFGQPISASASVPETPAQPSFVPTPNQPFSVEAAVPPAAPQTETLNASVSGPAIAGVPAAPDQTPAGTAKGTP